MAKRSLAGLPGHDVAAAHFKPYSSAPFTTKKANSYNRCYLLELPAELRDITYGYVLHQPDGLKIHGKASVADLAFALTKTCKQVRSECRSVLFRVNKVHFDLTVACAWLETPEAYKQYEDEMTHAITSHLESGVMMQARPLYRNLGSSSRWTLFLWSESFPKPYVRRPFLTDAITKLAKAGVDVRVSGMAYLARPSVEQRIEIYPWTFEIPMSKHALESGAAKKAVLATWAEIEAMKQLAHSARDPNVIVENEREVNKVAKIMKCIYAATGWSYEGTDEALDCITASRI